MTVFAYPTLIVSVLFFFFFLTPKTHAKTTNYRQCFGSECVSMLRYSCLCSIIQSAYIILFGIVLSQVNCYM